MRAEGKRITALIAAGNTLRRELGEARAELTAARCPINLWNAIGLAIDAWDAAHDARGSTTEAIAKIDADSCDYAGALAAARIRIAALEAKLAEANRTAPAAVEEAKAAVNTFFREQVTDDALFLTGTTCGHFGEIGVTCFCGDTEFDAILAWYRSVKR